VVEALQTLGLDEEATAETIKARYKKLVKELHPDVNAGDRSREARLRDVIAAYHTLRKARMV
jgi:DnaJ-class molecular chaperone